MILTVTMKIVRQKPIQVTEITGSSFMYVKFCSVTSVFYLFFPFIPQVNERESREKKGGKGEKI